jgi:hypothetical protein
MWRGMLQFDLVEYITHYKILKLAPKTLPYFNISAVSFQETILN